MPKKKENPFKLLFENQKQGVKRKKTADNYALGKRQVQAALKQAEGRYRSIIETTQEGICIVNEDGKITYSNKHMADILGYTVKEIEGSFLYKYLD